MQNFTRKPLPVTAIQWTGDNLKEVLDFTGKADNWDEYFASFEEYEKHVAEDGRRFKVFTPCHTLIAEVGDWVVRTHEGEVVIVHKERFPEEFEPAEKAAHVWHKNGDHPDDYKEPVTGWCDVYTPEEQRKNGWEGQIVRYYRHPNVDGQSRCSACEQKMHNHGWIDQGKEGLIVCPGNTVVTLADGTYKVRK